MHRNESQLDPVEEASLESFPASDAPSRAAGRAVGAAIFYGEVVAGIFDAAYGVVAYYRRLS